MTYDYYEISEGIFCHPEVMGGRPTVGKFRIPVSIVAPHIFTQTSDDEVLEDFPLLNRESINNLRLFLKEVLCGRITPPTDKAMAQKTREYLLHLLQGVERYPREDIVKAIEEAQGDSKRYEAIDDLPVNKKIRQFCEIMENSWVFVRA